MLLGVKSSDKDHVQSDVEYVKDGLLVLDTLMDEDVGDHDAMIDEEMGGSVEFQPVEDHQDAESTVLSDQKDAERILKLEEDNSHTEIHTPQLKFNTIIPCRKAAVIIYTTTKASVTTNKDDPFKPSSPHTPLQVPGEAVVGDGESVFSLGDSIDSEDGTDDVFLKPMVTRRASTISPSVMYGMELALDHDPITYPRRKNPLTPTARDEKGRFTSRRSSSVQRKRSREKYAQATDLRKTVSEPNTPITRDKKGKFASKNTDSNESASKKRKRALSVGADSRLTTSSHASGSKPIVSRDSHGRFARKESNRLSVTRDLPMKFLQMEDYSSAIHREVPDLLKNPDPLNYILDTMAQIARDLEASAPKPKAKALKTKRAPAKSPYFPTPPKTPSKKIKVREKKEDSDELVSSLPQPRTPKIKTELPAKRHRTPGKIVSCIPFPPLSAPHFGLIQEKLAHDPFRLLIAVTFLIRTHGKHAIPVFYSLMSKYPTPESLISAKKEDIISIIQHLGLQNQRATTYQTYAKIWLENPPMKGKRYPIRGYPTPSSGRDVSKDEILSDTDEREAWEIGHMTSGPYALDSWRIFCRDELRGLADGWNGEGNREDGFQPEWMRILPEDKELRAFLRWMWLKEGFEWDPFTGEKEVASEELLRAAMEGRIAWDERGGMSILEEDEMGEVLNHGAEASANVDDNET